MFPFASKATPVAIVRRPPDGNRNLLPVGTRFGDEAGDTFSVDIAARAVIGVLERTLPEWGNRRDPLSPGCREHPRRRSRRPWAQSC